MVTQRIRTEAIEGLKLHPQAHLVPEMRGDEWKDFYQDIVFRGIKVPLEVLADGTIVDGRHRFRAAKEMGLKQVPVIDAILGSDDSTTYMIKAAVFRRHLTDDQRAMMGHYWKQENKQAPGPQPGGDRDTDTRISVSLGYAHNPTETKAAETFKVAANAIKKATYVAARRPDLAAQVHNGEMPLNRAYQQVKTHQPKPPGTFPDGTYGVLYADPPWKYEFSLTTNRDIENQYTTMTVDQICALEDPTGRTVQSVAAPDSTLLLWVTSPKLLEGLQVMESWGFQYKTCAVWVKERIGMGYYFRQQHELLLVGTKGKGIVPLPENRIASVIINPRGVHSEKPLLIKDAIAQMYPGIPKIELFARLNAHGEATDESGMDLTGWTYWGNDVGGKDNDTAIP